MNLRDMDYGTMEQTDAISPWCKKIASRDVREVRNAVRKLKGDILYSGRRKYLKADVSLECIISTANPSNGCGLSTFPLVGRYSLAVHVFRPVNDIHIDNVFANCFY